MPGTDLALGLVSSYAMCGTDLAYAATSTPLALPPIHVHPSPRRRSDDVERGGIAAANGGNSAGNGGNSAGNGGNSAGNGGGSMEDGGIWRT
eukprot:3121848-Rhodomonas_salina.5